MSNLGSQLVSAVLSGQKICSCRFKDLKDLNVFLMGKVFHCAICMSLLFAMQINSELLNDASTECLSMGYLSIFNLFVVLAGSREALLSFKSLTSSRFQ